MIHRFGRANIVALTATALLLTGSFTAWATGSIPDAAGGDAATAEQSSVRASMPSAVNSETDAASAILTDTTQAGQFVLDPDAGGSPEVVYPDPSEFEQPVAGNPEAPTNLRITALGDTTVTASFDAPAGVDNLSAYIRYGDSFTQQGLGANTSVTFTGLTADWDKTL